MKTRAMVKFVVAFLAMAPMVALPETSGTVSKPTSGAIAKQHKGKPSAFKKEFEEWAAKQDWFALSDKAEFGDANRKKKAEKGMSFGYSVEFFDSKGRRFILGVGLAKEPDVAAKKEMKRDMAEMSAKKNLMTHGIPVTTDASGAQSRSVSGTANIAQVLSTTIVRPGTEDKWILCVCTGKRQEEEAPRTFASVKENRPKASHTAGTLFYPAIRCREKNGTVQVFRNRNADDFSRNDMERARSSVQRKIQGIRAAKVRALRARMRQQMRKHDSDYWLTFNPEFDRQSRWVNVEEGDVCLIGSIIRVIGDDKTPAQAVFDIGDNSSVAVGEGTEFVLQVAPVGVSGVDDLDMRELVLRKGRVDLNLPIDLKDGLFRVETKDYKCANVRGKSQFRKDVISCVTGSMELVCEYFKFAHLVGGNQLRISSWPGEKDAICRSDYGYGTEILCENGDCNAQLNIEEFVGREIMDEVSKVINSFDVDLLPQSKVKISGHFSSKCGIIRERCIQVFNGNDELMKSIGINSTTEKFKFFMKEGDEKIEKIWEKQLLHHLSSPMKPNGGSGVNLIDDEDD